MEVKIGVQYAARELTIESTKNAEELEQALTEALAKGGVLSLEDEKGRKVFVPVDRLAYIELGEPSVRRVGFGAL